MKILITAPNVFTGDTLKVGCYYTVELADEGTDAQGRAFHALLQCYWASGCHSYDARSFLHFRALIKLYLGAGTEKFYSLVNEDGTLCPQGRIGFRLKSWSDYSKDEILQGMEEQSSKRQKENKQ